MARFLSDYRTDSRQNQRLERILAFGRAFLAICALGAIYLDPTEPARFAALTYTLLSAYALYSILVLLWIRRRLAAPQHITYWLHGIDIGFAAAITFFSEGPVSPFFLFFLFAVLAAAYRWAFAETLGTALITASVYLVETAVAMYGPWQQTIFAEIKFDFLSTILQVTYLLLTGALLGYLAHQEKQIRAEMAATTAAMKLPAVAVGLGGSVSATASLLMRLFESRAADIIIQDHESARTMLWYAEAAATARAPRRLELEAGQQSAWLFAGPSASWCTLAPPDGATVGAVATDRLGKWSTEAQSITLESAFLDARDFRTLAVVDFGLPGEWRGRVILYDPRQIERNPIRMHFLSSLAEHLTPALSNVFLLRRLRSRASAAERARVARELHDGAIQALIGIEMEAEAMRRRAGHLAPWLDGELAHIQQLMRREVVSLRELMQELRPPDMDEAHQLPDLLAGLAERFRRDSGIATHFVSDANTASMPLRTAIEATRITQEALANVRKHSGANRVLVRLSHLERGWTLSIEDDGRGFAFDGRLEDADLRSRWAGPAMLMERARLVGATVAIESRPARGAVVEVTFG
jgi:signal transduction histidine kinase